MGTTSFAPKNKLWLAVATLVSVIVGAGVLGIPYVVAKAGFLLGAVIIIAIGLLFVALNLMTAEIILRTKGRHQLTGYIEQYLGSWGKTAMAASMILGIYGALIAYFIGEGETLHVLFSPLISLSPLVWSLIFFVVAAIIVYRGAKAASKVELYAIIAMIVVVLAISIGALFNFTPNYLTHFEMKNVLIPLGVIIFAFISSAGIPEVNVVLGKEKKLFKKSIIIGSIIPIFIYLIFAASVIGSVGLQNFELLQPDQRIATIALSYYSHPLLGIFANLFAVFAMATSFFSLGIALVEMYQFDYHFNKTLALAFTLAIPLLVALLNLSTFLQVLGITGALAGGIDGVLIVLAYWRCQTKSQRKPEFTANVPRWLASIILGIFVFAAVYGTWQLFL